MKGDIAMIVQNGLVNIFEFMDAFDVPDAVQGIYKILMIPGIFFVCLLLKDWVIESWKRREFHTWYKEKSLSKQHKKNKDYILWRKSQIKEKSRSHCKKWKKRCKWKRRSILAIGVLLFIGLTEMIPVGNQKKSIQDVYENQAVLAIQYYQRCGIAVPTRQMIVIDGKGRWKDFYLSDDGLDTISEMEECITEEGFEPTPEFLDAVLASERIPFKKRRLILTKRTLENAINTQSDSLEDTTLPWDLKCSYQKYFYNITGREASDVHYIGSRGMRNSMYTDMKILPLYFVFMQTGYPVRELSDIFENGYIQEIVFLLAGLFLVKMLYPIFCKTSR